MSALDQRQHLLKQDSLAYEGTLAMDSHPYHTSLVWVTWLRCPPSPLPRCPDQTYLGKGTGGSLD